MHPQKLAQDHAQSKPSRKPATPRPDPWYKRYPQDYKRGTRKLSLAARGAYSDILDMIYMEGGPIADDDFGIACELRVKLRQWLTVRKELFAAGKLISLGGRISNPKADEVLAERELAKSDKPKRTPRAVLGAASRVAERCANNVANEKLFQGKDNEINGGCTTEPESQIAESDGSNIITLRASKELAGLNGAAEPMLKDIIAWMHGGDQASAREWLGKQVAVYGQEIVRNSYSKLSTDIASGMVIGRPLQTWCRIATRMQNEPQTEPSPEPARTWHDARTQADMEWGKIRRQMAGEAV